MNLNEHGMTDDRLAHSMSNVPPRSFVLLEDVDAAFVSRQVRWGSPGVCVCVCVSAPVTSWVNRMGLWVPVCGSLHPFRVSSLPGRW